MSVTSRPPDGLASIIVPCFNQREYTRHCLRALAKFTRPPWELIVVDNGSQDGTAAYLEGVGDVASFPMTLVANGTNRGFPAAVNQGIAASKGDYVVLLNNDAVVTDGWLDQLVALAESDPSIGMTGPMSNYVSPPQLVAEVPYRDLAEMHVFADRWRDLHRGEWFEAEKLSGFCLLIKRKVLDTVGGFDEGFGLGLFDDDDFCRRAGSSGFRRCVARDLFVHHFGSRTFAGSEIDADTLLEANAAIFSEKWGPESLGRPVSLASWSGAGDPSTESRPPQVSPAEQNRRACRVSLTMIVRNEEKNLPACLGSASGLFDEIVVVDTGSTDRTIEIARSFGAKVSEFPWIDDFAAARNAALSRATGDYAFWLDADDVLDLDERSKLVTLLDRLSLDDLSAYVVRCACDPDSNGGGGRTVVDHVRLFPLRADIRWCYRVHEQILPAVRRAGVPVQWTDVVVRHTGYTDPALRGRKLERDQGILERELGERPDDPFVLFNLGSIAIERLEWQAALGYLARSLSGSSPGDSITRKLFALISRCHQMLGEDESALRACAAGLEADPGDAELLFRKGVLHRIRGEGPEAEACWRQILKLRRPEQFASLDEGIYGHLTRRNLAALAEGRGDLDDAMRLWSEVLEECPGDQEAIFKRNHITLRRRERLS